MSSSAPSTLLSALHSATVLDGLRDTENAHPFSDSYASTIASLRSLVSTTEQLNHSLAQLSTVPPNDPKLLSLLRQQTGFDYPRDQASSIATNFASLAKNRPLFPESIPFSSDGKLPLDYVLARIAQWGSSVKMETFTEHASPQKATVVLGGKVIVVDLELDAVAVTVVSVKTSFALNGEHTTASSPTLERFLSRSIGAWIAAVRRAVDVNQVLGTDEEDPAMIASRLNEAIQVHFKYIMTLDGLAAGAANGGIRWFTDAERVREAVDKQATAEGLPSAPSLDILLTRKPVPLNCVVSPALSFLIWLSPRAYLFLLRNAPSGKAPAQDPVGDVPRNQLMSYLVDSSGRIIEGSTVATLRLTPKGSGEDIGSVPSAHAVDGALPEVSSHRWILDFTDNSLRRRPALGNSRSKKEPRGVVMSQSRMRTLEQVLRESGDSEHSLDMGMNMHSSFNMGFTGPSWLDVLLQGGPNCSYSERYTATFRSTNGSVPAAKLRLNSPFEPGFLLQRVPVRRVSDIPKVLEIVKEQSWLNETLLSLDWVPENTRPQPQPESDDAETATPDMLDALLSGSFVSKSILINVFLPKSPLHPFVQSVASPEPMGDLESLAPADSVNKSLFGDVDMDMEIPGLSMGSMDGGMSRGLGGSMSGDLGGGMGGMDLGLDLGMSGGPSGSDGGIAPHTQPSSPEARPVPAIAMAIPMRSGGTTDVRVSFVGRGSGGTGNQVAGGVNGSEGTSTGLRVEIAGMTSLEPATLEEVVRRGGIWSLPGRIRASHK